MKKSLIIASVASLAFAATPMLGVSAAINDPAAVKDVLTVNVNGSCTFARTGAGSTGHASWDSTTSTYSKTMVANAVDTAFGTSTFTTHCNNPGGYSVSASFAGLTGPGSTISYSAETPAEGTGTWTAYRTFGQTTENIAATSGVLMSTDSEDIATGSTATVVYKVSLHANQAAGSYSGSATYTLSQK